MYCNFAIFSCLKELSSCVHVCQYRVQLFGKLFHSRRCYSCRLCESYVKVSKLSFTSSTFAHGVDAHWPLCPFELRGTCRDANCAFQMSIDYDFSTDRKAQDVRALFGRYVAEASACSALCHDGQSRICTSDSNLAARPAQLCIRLVTASLLRLGITDMKHFGAQLASRPVVAHHCTPV